MSWAQRASAPKTTDSAAASATPSIASSDKRGPSPASEKPAPKNAVKPTVNASAAAATAASSTEEKPKRAGSPTKGGQHPPAPATNPTKKQSVAAPPPPPPTAASSGPAPASHQSAPAAARPASPVKPVTANFAAAARKAAAGPAPPAPAAVSKPAAPVRGASAKDVKGKPDQHAKPQAGKKDASIKSGSVNGDAPVQFRGAALKKMPSTNMIKKPSFGSFDTDVKSQASTPAAPAAKAPVAGDATKSSPAESKAAVSETPKTSAPRPEAAPHAKKPVAASAAKVPAANAAPISEPAKQSAPAPSAVSSAAVPASVPAAPAAAAASPVDTRTTPAPSEPSAPVAQQHSQQASQQSHQQPHQQMQQPNPHQQQSSHQQPNHHQQQQQAQMAYAAQQGYQQQPFYPMHPQQQQQGHFPRQAHQQPQHHMRPPTMPIAHANAYPKPYRPSQPHMGMPPQNGPPQGMPTSMAPNGAPMNYYPGAVNMHPFHQQQQPEFMYMGYPQFQQQYVMANGMPMQVQQGGPPRFGGPSSQGPMQPPSTPKVAKPRVSIKLSTPDGKAIHLPKADPTVHVHPPAVQAAVPSAPIVKAEPAKRVAVVLSDPNTGKKLALARDGSDAVEANATEATPAVIKKDVESKPKTEAPVTKKDVEPTSAKVATPTSTPAPVASKEASKPVKDVAKETPAAKEATVPAAKKVDTPAKAEEKKSVAEVAAPTPVVKTDVKDKPKEETAKPSAAVAAKATPETSTAAKVEAKKEEAKKAVLEKQAAKADVKKDDTKTAAVSKNDVAPAPAVAPAKAAEAKPVPAPVKAEAKPAAVEAEVSKPKAKTPEAPVKDLPAAKAVEDDTPAIKKTDPEGVTKTLEVATKPDTTSDAKDAKPESSASKDASIPQASSPTSTEAPVLPKTAVPAKIDTKIDTKKPQVMTRLQSFDGISYPDSVTSPSRGPGQPFQYQRDFLMQFQPIIKDKPEGMGSLDHIFDDKGTSPGGAGGGGRGSRGPGSRQGSMTDVRSNASAPKTSEERFAQAMGKGVQGVMGVMGSMGVAVPHSSRMSRTPSSNHVMPQRQASFRDQQGGQRNDGRGSRGGRDRPGAGRPGIGRMDTTIDLNQEPVEPLVKSEAAWGPGSFRKSLKPSSDPEDQQKNEEELIHRKVKGLLNKLTVEKFQPISEQILNVGMTREAILKGVIAQIFEKALDEPNFGAMYAALCVYLSTELPKVQAWIEVDIKTNTFRRVLLNRCQEEFENNNKWAESEEKLMEQRREARARLATMSDEEKQKIAEEDYERQKLKRRSLGNMSFIGELFIKNLITEKIMHSCVLQLLKNKNVDEPEEEECESLCKLLTTIGQRLDHEKAQPMMNSYFTRIAELSVHQKLSARIRFMLLDLIDMRKDGWKSRVESTGPKTIAEIRAEAERKAAIEEAGIAERNKASGGGGGRGGGRGGGQFRDRRGGGGGGRGGGGSHDTRGSHGGNNDGWTTQGSRGVAPNAQLSRPGDLQHFGQMAKPTNAPLSFGPAGGMGFGKGASGWGGKKKDTSSSGAPLSRSGSSAGTAESSVAAAPANIFSLLTDDSSGDRKKSIDEGRKPASVESKEDETPAAVKEVSKKEAKRKFDGIVQEWQSLLDVNEVILSLEEIKTSAFYVDFLEELFNKTWDKKSDVIKKTRKLLVQLLQRNIVSKEDVQKALTVQMEFAEDVAIDVPAHYVNLAALLGRLVSDNVLTMTEVLAMSGELIKSRARTKPPALTVLLEVLKDIQTNDGDEALVKIVADDGVDLALFWPEDRRTDTVLSDWLDKNGMSILNATTTNAAVATTTTASPSANDATTKTTADVADAAKEGAESPVSR
ncbi:hypothetical protein HKX48_004162 [Thoreauomyces humboldtii]|nr:hypothetical protein HKX48_004162 [Thoreauomyces humboldtii]